MAGSSTTLVVKILTDASKASKGTDAAASTYQKFGAGLDKMVPAALGVSAAIVGIAAVSVQSASRTQQAMGALDSVFGKNSAVVKGWAADAADSAGLSEAAYAELASGIGAQLNNLGLSQEDALAGTKNLITVGADLAATFGGSTQQAVEALGSALRGEADPAERYGLSLSQTAVNAKLAEDGMSDLTGTALKTAKTQAILALATEQAGGALGQFDREANTAAGAAERASANFENAKSALGTSLLPVVAAVTAKLAEMAKWVQQNSTLVMVIVGVIGAFAAVIITLSVAMKVATAVQWALNAALAANPIGLVVIAVIAVIAAIVLLWTNVEGFRNFFIGVWKAISGAAVAAWNWVVGVIKNVFGVIMALGRAYVGAYVAAFKAVAAVAVTVWNAIVKAVTTAWNWILNLGRNAIAFYVNVWNMILSSARNVWNAIMGVVGGVLNWIIGAARGVGNAVAGVWNGILSTASNVWNTLSRIVQGALSAIMGPVNAVADAFWGIVDAVSAVIGWISRIRIPDLSALNPFKAVMAAPATAGVSTFAASPALGAGLRKSPSLAAFGVTGGGSGITINVSGGLDSADTIARRIQQLVQGRERRTSGVVVSRRAV